MGSPYSVSPCLIKHWKKFHFNLFSYVSFLMKATSRFFIKARLISIKEAQTGLNMIILTSPLWYTRTIVSRCFEQCMWEENKKDAAFCLYFLVTCNIQYIYLQWHINKLKLSWCEQESWFLPMSFSNTFTFTLHTIQHNAFFLVTGISWCHISHRNILFESVVLGCDLSCQCVKETFSTFYCFDRLGQGASIHSNIKGPT